MHLLSTKLTDGHRNSFQTITLFLYVKFLFFNHQSFGRWLLFRKITPTLHYSISSDNLKKSNRLIAPKILWFAELFHFRLVVESLAKFKYHR